MAGATKSLRTVGYSGRAAGLGQATVRVGWAISRSAGKVALDYPVIILLRSSLEYFIREKIDSTGCALRTGPERVFRTGGL